MIRRLRSGKRIFNVEVTEFSNKSLKLQFPWSHFPEWENLKNEIKSLRGARFHKEKESFWTIDNCERNRWALDHLDYDKPDPYGYYDSPCSSNTWKRQLYRHQQIMADFAYSKKRVLIAAEMGTGKTLVTIEVLEKVQPQLAWYVAPKFALQAIRLEFGKWKAKVWPMFISYDEMRGLLKNWKEGKVAPDFIIFDESAYLKTPGSQRSQYAQQLVEGMRQDHKDPYIILMSGAPAPKSPEDWWKQCEIACPGFLKEGHPATFKQRLALIRTETSFAGGSYPKLVTWFDDERKCKVCGQFKDSPNHSAIEFEYHDFQPSKNEVAYLYERLKGLVLIQFKKDCLDLPDKLYRIINCPISASMKRAMQTIIKSSPTTIEALTRCRELSDGFQYENTVDENKFVICPHCKGTKEVKEYEPERTIPCPTCAAVGMIPKPIQKANYSECPKDQALIDLLEENEEIGRIVIYAGFTASVDRCVELCKKQKWAVIRVDGRGMHTSEIMNNPLQEFQDTAKRITKLAFVAHPATAKTALTLTAASMLVYYSNTFNGDDRIQSEDRIHRIGMDVNRGATIVDIIHLPTDQYVLDNLKSKRALQGITLGEFKESVKNYVGDGS